MSVERVRRAADVDMTGALRNEQIIKVLSCMGRYDLDEVANFPTAVFINGERDA